MGYIAYIWRWFVNYPKQNMTFESTRNMITIKSSGRNIELKFEIKFEEIFWREGRKNRCLSIISEIHEDIISALKEYVKGKKVSLNVLLEISYFMMMLYSVPLGKSFKV